MFQIKIFSIKYIFSGIAYIFVEIRYLIFAD